MDRTTDAARVLDLLAQALPVRGTVAAVPNINGGLTVRVSGRTVRAHAVRALTAAGYPVALDDVHGVLRIPTPRKATR